MPTTEERKFFFLHSDISGRLRVPVVHIITFLLCNFHDYVLNSLQDFFSQYPKSKVFLQLASPQAIPQIPLAAKDREKITFKAKTNKENI